MPLFPGKLTEVLTLFIPNREDPQHSKALRIEANIPIGKVRSCLDAGLGQISALWLPIMPALVKEFKRAFATASDRAALQDVTSHILRHTCATWLMRASVPTWRAAGFLGMTEETLIRVYGHHHPDHQRQAVTAF